MKPGLKKVIVDETFKEIQDEINNLKKGIKPLITRDTEVLKKRYYEELSYFQQMAFWYDSLKWWQQAALSIAVLSAVVLASIVLNAVTLVTFFSMIVFNVVAIPSIIGFFALLKNESLVDEKRAERMCADVVQLENNLKTSISLFETTHKKLLDLFNETNEANQALNNYTVGLEGKNEEMAAEIAKFKTIISNLQQSQQDLGANTAQFAKAEEGILKNLSTLETLISQDLNFSQFNQEVNKTTKECQENTVLLNSVNGLMKGISQSLNASIATISNDIDSLNADRAANEQESPSVYIPTDEEINQQQVETDDLLAEAQEWLREARNSKKPKPEDIPGVVAFTR
ncbi:MAG: hypothetical protein K2X39_03620 [Silvanigrellaceae bacterium]|nr:hypothetical protein [Silvanigrellaceae bacterium]